MNKALLPILARLHSLRTTSHLAVDGGRIIASRSDPNPITVVLREINETVLARVLTFTTEGGTSLAIEAAGRRILRIADANGLEGAEPCLAAAVLEDEHKDNLIKLLQAFAKPRQEIRLTVRAGAQGSEGVSIGLPVALIADLLLVELNGLDAEVVSEASPPRQPEPPVPVDAFDEGGSAIGRFARANGPVLMAWLIAGGEEDGIFEGPEEMVDHLKGFLDDEIKDLSAQLDRLSTAPGAPICLALGASLTEGHSLICARAEGSILLGLAEGDCTQTLMQAWTSALR